MANPTTDSFHPFLSGQGIPRSIACALFIPQPLRITACKSRSVIVNTLMIDPSTFSKNPLPLKEPRYFAWPLMVQGELPALFLRLLTMTNHALHRFSKQVGPHCCNG